MASRRATTQTLSPALPLVALGVAVCLVSFAFGRALLRDLESVQRLLAWLQPRAALACGALGAVAVVACRRELWAVARQIPRAHWLMLASVLALTTATRVGWVPAAERVYFDEHAYRQIAGAIASEGRAHLAASGRIVAGHLVTDLPVYEHWPAGWPSALAVAFRVTSGARGTGPALNLMLSIATTLLVALIASQRKRAGHLPLVAATLHACLPAVAIWSRTGAAEPMAYFCSAAAVLVATIAANAPTLRVQILLGTVSALAAMTRNESIAMIPIAMLVAGWSAERFTWRLPLPALATAAWLLPVQALHLGVVARGYDADTIGSGLGLVFVWHNLASLGRYLAHEPVALTLVLLAVFAAFRRTAVPYAAWAAVGLAPSLFYFAGSLSYPGGERFVLAWLAPCAIIAGAGVIRLDTYCARWSPTGLRVGLSIGYVAVCLVWLTVYVRRADDDVATPRREVAALRDALRSVPEDAVVVAAYPFVVLAEHRTATFLADASSAGRVCALARRAPGGVFLWIGPTAPPATRSDAARAVDVLTEACAAVVVDGGRSEPSDGRLYQARGCADCNLE